MKCKSFCLMFILLFVSLAKAQSSEWRVFSPQWTPEDERNFGRFVTMIGSAVEARSCYTVDGCMKSSANPYRYGDPWGMNFRADCADLPYLLRGYFAWKNGLPMSVESSLTPRNGVGGDIRYSTFGNRVTGRYDIVSRGFLSQWASWFNDDSQSVFSRFPNAISALNTIINVTSSGSYRMMGFEDEMNFTDFYPVKIDREGIHPGTVIYDPNGHVAIVYKVSDDGRVFYIDAHPDNSLTSGMYNRKFVRSSPFHGAGFKNFRPLALVNSQVGSNGTYIGGRVIAAKNNQLYSYSLEQFFGNSPDPQGDWTKGKFVINGVPVSYYDYVRIKLAKGVLKIDPLQDMKANVVDICKAIKDRVDSVQTAVNSGIQNQYHPERLPYNIYGSDGEWESYATPSRDARLKVSFMEVLSDTQNNIQRYNSGDPMIVYNGSNLPADLLKTYLAEAQSCRFTYINSRGQSVTLNLESIRQRLFDLSFDPYHCIELRWGAKAGAEFESCDDSSNKLAWYRQERWLRNQYERRYDVRMDYSLAELTGPKPGAGIAQPPDVDIIGYLNRQMNNRLSGLGLGR